MPPTLVDLRPERRLLDPNFEGYKLRLEAIAHWRHNLPAKVDKLYPDEVQYSFVHAKLFALHNHLVADNWNQLNNLYYIDDGWNVHRVTFDHGEQKFDENIVYDIPSHIERKSGHFNTTLFFISNEYAAVSDGTGNLHIVFTGNRNNVSNRWSTVYSNQILGTDKYFVISDVRSTESNDVLEIHCLILSIEQTEKQFDTVLSWVTIKKSNDNWSTDSLKQIKGKGVVHYAAIENGLNAVYVASNHPFKYIVDSEQVITEDLKKIERKILYTWLQTTEDISLTFQVPAKFEKDLIKVSVEANKITIGYGGTIYLDGKLKNNIDNELTTWNIDSTGKLDVLITKLVSGIWSHFVEGGDESGEQILDPSLVEETHRRLAHLCSETEISAESTAPAFANQQLEECDAVSDEDTVLVRLDAVSHEATHRIPLSVQQYLFSISLDPNEVPALALRHDVDACIWQPHRSINDNQLWPVKHMGTLMAFGYVQSSKQNRKFTTCSPDFSYSVVCESSRHVFIYRLAGHSNQGCQLRQRQRTGDTRSVNVGQQQVFNLDKDGEVLGIHATNDILYILTETNLIALEMIC